MNRAEKENGTEIYSTHCFPSIQPSAIDSPDRDGKSDLAFRPLYQSADGTSDGRMVDFQNRCGPNGNAHIEESKGESYTNGFEAGKAEACKIVQQELDLPIRQFRTAANNYQDCFTHITETYCDQIMRLTMAIARNILGPHVELDMERQEPMRQHLQSYLRRQYRLSMTLNPNDFKSLSDIMACEDPQWHQTTALHVSGDGATRKGQIEVQPVQAVTESLKDNFSQEFEALINDR